jgi:Zn-dependent peptidase ImmA (M78 family)/transcriptional regulator with XRE-family HTH domain
MPKVNHDILRWARETAGLSIDQAVDKLGINDARGVVASDRLTAIEQGTATPSRPLLLKMAQQYRRPLVAFYMSAAPQKGDRGQDFRNIPDRQSGAEALIDALVRDVRARQSTVRDVLVDEDETRPLPFVGSMTMANGVDAVVDSIRRTLGIELAEFRSQRSPELAFTLLRARTEAVGVFVLLIGNLGSHHTSIDVEAFRGFALADTIAPFIVINDQDHRSAWSFTLIHELAHLWLGTTGVSGGSADIQIEKFCNDVAAGLLLPRSEIASMQIDRGADLQSVAQKIGEFAEVRHLSRSMVAYNFARAGLITDETWLALAVLFRAQWRQGRDALREKQRGETGPNYYVVRRHRLGAALLHFVSRNMSEGALTPTKAGRVLGVKPRSVGPLLEPVTTSGGRAA